MQSEADSSQPHALFVAGVGASAGGLEALERLFSAMPSDTGIAFVVVQHLSPDFKSMMDELLGRHTRLVVRQVKDGMRVEADHVYLIPPGKDMIISDGRLLLSDKPRGQELSLPIDTFFRSLARDLERRAIAIVLSGSGSDGSRGIRTVHDAGGLVLCQDGRSARFDGMPRSARDTGLCDYVLAPEDMPRVLLDHVRQAADVEPTYGGEPARLNEVLHLLQQVSGVDFSAYKANTVLRRIERRLRLSRSEDLTAYLRQLKERPDELNSLYQDLLIGVTQFFRDPEVFDRLESDILDELLRDRGPEEELRLWVAGCATGEEVYSLAMLVHERLEAMAAPPPARLFATDVHRVSLEKAGAGLYPAEALQPLSEARQARYFVDRGGCYQIDAALRQMVVFAVHDVTRDAPFTRMDLISCRNLLIYLQPQAQQKVLSLLHFGLRRGGFLLLGPSENLGELSREFATVDDGARIFRKRYDDARGTVAWSNRRQARPRDGGPLTAPLGEGQPLSRVLGVYDTLLQRCMPPSLLVNERREVVHTFGGAGRYIAVRDGRPSLDVLDLVEGDLKLALTGALQRSLKSGTTLTCKGIHHPAASGELRLKLEPLGQPSGMRHVLITLEEGEAKRAAPEPASPDIELSEVTRERMASLEEELRYTRENLQATIEELETSNEELQSTNEELVASNEELQSTNEELQSVNEELYTVNSEHQRKIQQLTELSTDIDNLLASTDVGAIFLESNLNIRKFTPRAAPLFNLLPQDLGRPIESFSHGLDDEQLVADAGRVLDGGGQIERNVRDRHGNWYLVRILPYRSKGSVDGVVITFIDINQLKRAEHKIQEAVRRRDQFIAMLSHELRNPLAAIINAAQLIEVTDGDAEKRQQAHGVIHRQSRHMARLLDDLLDTSRVTQNKLQLRCQTIDVADIVRQAAQALSAQLAHHEIELHVDVGETPLHVWGDPARLEQVLGNLLHNAVKYSRRGGNVWLSARRDQGEAQISVRDDGAGIAPDLIDKIFDIFVQSEGTIHRSEGGMGLGLTLVQALVHLHGGSVLVQSAGLGHGSEFVVRIPLLARQVELTERIALPAQRPRSLCIALVEDNPDARETLRTLLELDGHVVVTACDGVEGLELIRNRRPDLALIDIGLPEKNGYELARDLRRALGRDGIVLVALTGYGRDVDREAALESGFDAHLVKPVDRDALGKILSGVDVVAVAGTENP